MEKFPRSKEDRLPKLCDLFQNFGFGGPTKTGMSEPGQCRIIKI